MGLIAKLTCHPAAEIFPSLQPAEYANLERDIVQNGLLEEIVLLDGQILDGRHRYRVCLDHNITPRFCKFDGENPLDFVLGRNLARRHLNAGQRALLAAVLADQKPGGDRSKTQKCALTHAGAAALCNVSKRQVDKASAVLNAVSKGIAVDQLVDLVRANKLSLNYADKIARLPKTQQLELLAQKDNQSHKRSTRGDQVNADGSHGIADGMQRLRAQLAGMIRQIRKMRESAPELREPLTNICEHAAQLLADEAKLLSFMPGGPKGLPIEEVNG